MNTLCSAENFIRNSIDSLWLIKLKTSTINPISVFLSFWRGGHACLRVTACETVPRVNQIILRLTIFQSMLLKKMYTRFCEGLLQSTVCCTVHCIVTAALITLYHLQCDFIYSYTLSVHADNIWKLSSVQYKLYVSMQNPWKFFRNLNGHFWTQVFTWSTKPLIYAVQEPPNKKELMWWF